MTPGGTTPGDRVPATSGAGFHEHRGENPGEHVGVPGTPGTWSVDVDNIRYRGEVVVAESFQPEHGELLALSRTGEFESAVTAVRTCPSPGQPDLSVAPVCARCALTLTDEVPDGDTIARKADAAMAEHGHRLALAASGRVLRQDDKSNLAMFLEPVQAGDSAKIANVLDAEVPEFLRDFVRAKGQ